MKEMKYGTFLKERGFIAGIFGWLFFSIETFLLTFRNSWWLILYVAVMLVGGYFLLTYLEFRRRKHFMSEVCSLAEKLEEPYLIGELMLPAETEEEKLFQELLQDLGKSMKEHVKEYRQETKEYKEYIELWIHEVKIPIASARLMLENHRDRIPKGLEGELERIEGYTEQALFYARSNDVEKDYFIKELCLKDVAGEVLLQNRRELLGRHCEIKLHDMDGIVYSDGKWLSFILNQIISNSIKYAGEQRLSLEIYSVTSKENVTLVVKDNGIGIRQEELSRVFDKGFTGSNGRLRRKSTGIGLYLCQKLCKRLGHTLVVESEEGKGCTVKLIFPKSSYHGEALH